MVSEPVQDGIELTTAPAYPFGFGPLDR